VIQGLFALKELKNRKRNARFEREIEAIRRVGPHAHVIQLVDDSAFSTSDDAPFYVMPLAERSLADEVLSGALSLEESFRWFEQICQGVEHLHSHGVLHRDLKPENVLIFGRTPVVSDLGLCLITDLPRLTPTSEVVGPRFYMAPELEDGRNLEVTVRADIYSLGKILYFLLSKGHVFARENWRAPDRRLDRILDDERLRVFDLIFAASIEAESVRRFRSVSELREAFLKKVSEFEKHPRTLLAKKIGKFRADEFALSSKIDSLDAAELKVAVADLASAANSVEEGLCIKISQRLDVNLAAHFIEVLKISTAKISQKTLQAIAECFVTEGALFSKVLSANMGEELFGVALRNGSINVAKGVAKHGFVWLRRQRALVLEILGKYDHLDGKERTNLLLECIYVEAEEVVPLLIGISRRADLSGLEATLVIAALSAQRVQAAVERLVEMGQQLTDESAFRAFGQGLGLRARPETLHKLKEADWGGRTLEGGLEVKSLMLKVIDVLEKSRAGGEEVGVSEE
jgi:hypothetical protein